MSSFNEGFYDEIEKIAKTGLIRESIRRSGKTMYRTGGRPAPFKSQFHEAQKKSFTGTAGSKATSNPPRATANPVNRPDRSREAAAEARAQARRDKRSAAIKRNRAQAAGTAVGLAGTGALVGGASYVGSKAGSRKAMNERFGKR